MLFRSLGVWGFLKNVKAPDEIFIIIFCLRLFFNDNHKTHSWRKILCILTAQKVAQRQKKEAKAIAITHLHSPNIVDCALKHYNKYKMPPLAGRRPREIEYRFSSLLDFINSARSHFTRRQ